MGNPDNLTEGLCRRHYRERLTAHPIYVRMYFVTPNIMSRTASENCHQDDMSELWSESENLEVRRIYDYFTLSMLTYLPDR